MGATLAFPKTKANSVVDPLSLAVTFARRKNTALDTSCEMSPNKCNSSASIPPTKYARGIVMSLSFGSFLLHFLEELCDKIRWELVIPLLAIQSPDVFKAVGRLLQCKERQDQWGRTLRIQNLVQSFGSRLA